MISYLRVGLGKDLFNKVLRRKQKFPPQPVLLDEVKMPGQDSELHNGFVNCRSNEYGLNATFHRVEGGDLGCLWENKKSGLEGYPGMIHGGVTASVLDELMTNVVFHSTQKFGVTIKANFKWHKPLPTGDRVTGRGHVVFSKNQLARVKAYLFRSDGKVVASSDGVFFLPTVRQFKRISEIGEVPNELVQYFKS